MQKEDKAIKRLRRRKIILSSLFISFIILSTSWFILDRWAKRHGFTGAGDFLKTVTVNYWTSFDAEYETAEITINEEDYLKLESQREQHLNRGIITKTEDRYVSAIISYQGKKIKCKLRLKGHMTDHLQDGKWSFRIKTVKGDAFKGMKIFSLMHPGTRNYIYEWIYHQLLEQEGIATVRYSFLNLKVNGESWGIYALEENFAEELIGHHKLPKGPILGFNPDLYWYDRLNEHDKYKLNFDDLKINSSYPEAYDEKENFKSKEAQNNYAEAIVKMEKFKAGELSTSEAFDIDKLARFHAILDLVGGQFSLDWSDVKYYYNPITQKLEPVGYESFSVRNTSNLCGASKFKNKHSTTPEWHELLFSDGDFFKLYVKHLKRVAQSKYLNSFFEKQEAELQNNLAILYSEFPYKKLPLDPYYQNQKNIIALLKKPIIPAFYLEDAKNDSLYITSGSNSLLPVEMVAVLYQDKRTKLDAVTYISSKRNNEQVVYESIKFHFPTPDNFDSEKLQLIVMVPGSKSEVVRDVKPIEMESTRKYHNDYLAKSSNYKEFDFISVNESKKEIYFSSGEHEITKDLIFPAGYKIMAKAPISLNIISGARIISRSPMRFIGTEEYPIQIASSDSTGNGFIVLEVKEKSLFQFVDFSNLNRGVKKSDSHSSIMTFYEADVKFDHCQFSSETFSAVRCIRGTMNVINSTFYNFKEFALLGEYSIIHLNNVNFYNCIKNAVELNGSTGFFNVLTFNHCKNAILANNGADIRGNSIKISDGKIGFIAYDLSEIKLNEIDLRKVDLGFKAEKKSDVFGPSKIRVRNLSKEKVKNLFETDKKSEVIIE